MARISTYAIDGTPVSSDKLIGTDTAGTVTKNYPLGDVADWLKSSGATAVLGQNNYLFQIALDPDEGRKIGSFSFENYGGDGTAFEDVTNLKFSASSSAGKYIADYLLSTVDQKIMLSQLDAPNNFGIYVLVSLTQSSLEPTFYDAVLAFVDGNGALQGNESYGLATYSALNEAGGGTWGSITGNIDNQTDLVNYIDNAIAGIPVPPTPTLQSVTNEGNTTTNAISAGTITANNELHLVDSAMRIFRSSNDMRFRTNNSDNMTITSTGRVGIGTTNPISKLELQDGTFTVDNGNIDVFFGGISISRNSANNTALKVNQRGTADIFALQDDGTDVLTVIDGGNVGIGTTAPNKTLDIRTNGPGDGMRLATSENALYAEIINGNSESFPSGKINLRYGPTLTAGIVALSNSMELSGGYTTAGYIRFRSHTTEVMRMTNVGLGIGTTAPAYKFEVDEPTTNNLTVAKFTHQQGSVSSNVVFQNTAGADNTGFNLNFATQASGAGGVLGVVRTNSPTAGATDMFLSSSSGEAMRITSDGNVGIGTNSPAHVLHINKDNPYIQIQDSSAPTRADMSAGIIMKDSTGAQSFGITQSNSVDVSIRANAGDLSLGTFSGTVIKLDGNNVGIGTTAPAAKLDVRGTISQRVDASVSANQYPLQFFNDYSGTDYYLLRQRVVNSGAQVRTGLGITGAPDAAFVLGPQTDQTIKFSTNGRISNLTDIIAADPLRINSGEVRIGDISGSAASYLNVIQGASSTKPALGLKQGVGGSNKMITILNSSGAETMGITSEGGFYFRDNNLVGRFAFEHDYSPAAADGLTVGIDLRTENASGVVSSLGYIDVTQDDISADESSMRLSVGETTPTEVMRLQSGGNVGIGTSAPDSKLHVKATSGIAFKVDPNNADKEWYIDTTNPDHLKKEGNLILNADPTNVHTSTKISFNIDGSNKASINSDGDLGVGTTAQTSKVHVDGTAMRQLRMGTSGGPSSNTDTSGAIGDMAYDDNYFYIKTINGWGRVPLDFGF